MMLLVIYLVASRARENYIDKHLVLQWICSYENATKDYHGTGRKIEMAVQFLHESNIIYLNLS